MTALTREPSGSRASTSGLASSMRRPDPTDDLVDDAAQVRLVAEPGVDRVELAGALDEDVVGAVDHDLGDLRVAQQRLERAVAEDLVGDLLGDAGAVGVRERRLLGVDGLLQRLAHLGGELGLGKVRVVEPRAEAVDQGLVHAALDLAERVHGPPTATARAASVGDVGSVGCALRRALSRRSARLICAP